MIIPQAIPENLLLLRITAQLALVDQLLVRLLLLNGFVDRVAARPEVPQLFDLYRLLLLLFEQLPVL